MPDSVPFTIECGRGVSEVFTKAREMVNDARHWVLSGEYAAVYKTETHPRELYDTLTQQVAAMELSWWRCINSVIGMAGQSGSMQLWWDSERSLLFVEPRTGLTGGIIPHFKYVNDTRTPICEWSCHT